MWVGFRACPHAIKSCLPCVYPWRHADDKMYQTLPDLSWESLGMRLIVTHSYSSHLFLCTLAWLRCHSLLVSFTHCSSSSLLLFIISQFIFLYGEMADYQVHSCTSTWTSHSYNSLYQTAVFLSWTCVPTAWPEVELLHAILQLIVRLVFVFSPHLFINHFPLTFIFLSRDSPDDDWSSQSKHSAKVTLVCSWFHRTFLSIHIFLQKIANYFSSLLYAPPIFHISSPYFSVTVLRHLVCFN